MIQKYNLLFISLLSLGGSFITFLLGGWDTLIHILLALVVIDYISGVIAAGTEGRLSSQVGFKGIAQKILIFFIVAVAHFIDTLLGNHHLVRNWAILFYAVNEIISIIENASRVGLPIPPILKRYIELLKDRVSDEQIESKDDQQNEDQK